MNSRRPKHRRHIGFLNNATAQRCAPRPNANAWAQESYLGQHVPSAVSLLIWRHDPTWFPSGWILERVAQVCSHRRVSQLWRSTKVMGGEQRWGWRWGASLFHSHFCFHSGKVVKQRAVVALNVNRLLKKTDALCFVGLGLLLLFWLVFFCYAWLKFILFLWVVRAHQEPGGQLVMKVKQIPSLPACWQEESVPQECKTAGLVCVYTPQDTHTSWSVWHGNLTHSWNIWIDR